MPPCLQTAGLNVYSPFSFDQLAVDCTTGLVCLPPLVVSTSLVSSAMRTTLFLPAAAFVLLSHLSLNAASPIELVESEPELEKRCANPCGYNDWLCCGSSQTCSTNNDGEAVCLDGGGGGSGGGGGQWEYYTTTYVTTETDVSTITSVWSSHIAGATGSSGSCQPSLGETPCGGDCCDAASICVENECVVGSSSAAWPTATQTDDGSGTEATPPVRGTSNGFTTVTETSAPTTTQGFIAPVGTDGSQMIGVHASGGSGGGLSGGAIAGIVIGVIAGVMLLFLICACMCCRGAIDCLLGIFGCGHQRKRRGSDRHSRHSHSARPEGRTWFGMRPSRPERHEKKHGLGFWATIGVVVGAIALCLGLKRHRNHDDEKTDYSYPSSYYYYSDYTTTTSKSQPCVSG